MRNKYMERPPSTSKRKRKRGQQTAAVGHGLEEEWCVAERMTHRQALRVPCALMNRGALLCPPQPQQKRKKGQTRVAGSEAQAVESGASSVEGVAATQFFLFETPSHGQALVDTRAAATCGAHNGTRGKQSTSVEGPTTHIGPGLC